MKDTNSKMTSPISSYGTDGTSAVGQVNPTGHHHQRDRLSIRESRCCGGGPAGTAQIRKRKVCPDARSFPLCTCGRVRMLSTSGYCWWCDDRHERENLFS